MCATLHVLRNRANRPWFERSMPVHQDDVEFYVFHELRHLHQLIPIEKMLRNESCQDTYEQIAKWKYDFEHYIRNTDADSQILNLTQEVEVDANGYALSLLNLYYLNNGIPNPHFRYSLPEEAHRIADIRSREYYQTKPELSRFLQAMRIRYQQTASSRLSNPQPSSSKKRKIGRNEPCPCGSGKKFKQCCINRGIYD